MHGVGMEYPLQEWFDFKIPRTTIDDKFIVENLFEDDPVVIKPHSKWVWLGTTPEVKTLQKRLKGNKSELSVLEFHSKHLSLNLVLTPSEKDCLINALDFISLKSQLN